MCVKTVTNFATNAVRLRMIENAVEGRGLKETSVALVNLSPTDTEFKPIAKSFSHSSGVTARVGNKKVHVAVPSQNIFFPSTLKQRKYRQQFPAIQIRSYSNNSRRDTAGGDIVKGDKAGGDINKIEVKGNYAGRDNIQVGPLASMNTGTIIKSTGGTGLIFLFIAICATAYCYQNPEQEICKDLRLRVNKLFN